MGAAAAAALSVVFPVDRNRLTGLLSGKVGSEAVKKKDDLRFSNLSFRSL